MTYPILILQMQRMGDLILSFPLFFWLSKTYPKNPLWVVAEQMFFESLMPLSPNVAFFPVTALNRLKGLRFEMVVNLSHRPEAAALAPFVKTDAWIGKRAAANNATFIEGRWQLYRSSLTLNNRHNLFHWADLNALDIVSHKLMASTIWNTPRQADDAAPKIGLFLGASEDEKRPLPQFWANLAKELLNKGARPVFLGGPNDRHIGNEAARLAGMPALNLTGRFTIPELVVFMRELNLFVTPDTGPMHLAAWMDIPTLNLSMGPVNPWETGPYQPGHHVIQAAMSCTGCWRCSRERHACKDTFTARSVAALLRRISTLNNHAPTSMRGLRIARTDRNGGLYFLDFHDKNPLRHALGNFWRHFFAFHLGYDGAPCLGTLDSLQNAYGTLFHTAPELVSAMRKGVRKLAAEFQSQVIRRRCLLSESSWAAYPPLLRPLTGYMHPFLQNANYSAESRIAILKLLELLASLVCDHLSPRTMAFHK